MLSCFEKGLRVELACQVHNRCDGITQGLVEFETNNKKLEIQVVACSKTCAQVCTPNTAVYMCEYIRSVFAASSM